jgi:proton glutamate symport protein
MLTSENKIRFIAFAMALVVGIVHLASVQFGLNIDPLVLQFLRWVAIGFLTWFAINQKSLSTWILISMVIGAEIGYDFPELGKNLNVLGKIFMKLIKSIIAPLLFGTLIVGIAGHSDMKQVGRMGVKALIYFEVVTTIALAVGLIAINITKAGVGIVPPPDADVIPPHSTQTWQDIILHTFPENIAKSIADGQVLQIVVFTIIFALGLSMCSEEHKRPVLRFAESLSEVMFKFTKIVMYFAPFGVGGAMAYTVSNLGIDVFKNLLMLVITLYASLVVFLLCVLLPIAWWVGVPLKKFWRHVSEPASLAFATASSEAALASAMTNLKKFGLPDKVVGFVLPTGYTFNLDGTTLYLSLAAVFVAQAAGIELTITQQIVMGLTLMLTSKGVAGVARASLVILAGTAASFGLPEWPIAAILGVDALMDMARTTVNVIGNSLAAIVIARWEGEWSPETDIQD